MWSAATAAPSSGPSDSTAEMLKELSAKIFERLDLQEAQLRQLMEAQGTVACSKALSTTSTGGTSFTESASPPARISVGSGHNTEGTRFDGGQEKSAGEIDLNFLQKFQASEILGQDSFTAGRRKSRTASLAEQARHEKMIFDSKLRAKTMRFVIVPDDTGRMAWDVTAVVLIIFLAVSLPYRLAFLEFAVDFSSPSATTFTMDEVTVVDGWSIVDFGIDLFFIVDIMLNFRTAYYDPRYGHLVTDGRSMACHYVRTWFLLDLLASFPFDWCASGIRFTAQAQHDSGDSSLAASLPGMLRLFKLLKLLRLLRFARLLQLLGRIEDKVLMAVNAQTMRLVVVVLFLMVVAHWNGCIQFMIASFDVVHNATSGAQTLHPDTWIVRAKLESEPPGAQWAWCFYHAMTQLLAISTGIVEPRRQSEMWSYLASILLGATLYAIFVASITSIFSDSFASGRLYRSKLDQMLQYMRHSHMPKEICKKMRAHFELTFPGRTMYDEEGIVASLSHPLRGEIALHKFQRVLESLQVLHDARLSRAIATVLERLVFVHDDMVIFEGDVGAGMYFISAGAVEILIPINSRHSKGGSKMQPNLWPRSLAHLDSGAGGDGGDGGESMQVLATLGAQSFFGEMALLNDHHGGVAVASVRVQGFCEAYLLSLASYQALLVQYPAFRAYIEAVARLRLGAMIDAPLSSDEQRRPRRAVGKGHRPHHEELSLGELFDQSNPHARAMLREAREAAQATRRKKTGTLDELLGRKSGPKGAQARKGSWWKRKDSTTGGEARRDSWWRRKGSTAQHQQSSSPQLHPAVGAELSEVPQREHKTVVAFAATPGAAEPLSC